MLKFRIDDARSRKKRQQNWKVVSCNYKLKRKKNSFNPYNSALAIAPTLLCKFQREIEAPSYYIIFKYNINNSIGHAADIQL